MNILITGSRGFVGKHLLHELKNDIVFIPCHDSLDLLDKNKTHNYIKKIEPDIVIHLAAKVGGIGANMASPATFIYENLQMGINIIEACRLCNVKKLVNISTVCSYPKFCKIPFNENDIWNGYPEETNAPYGIAKKTIMEMCKAYRSQYGCNFITLVPVNLYGPEDNFNLNSSHVIPAIIRKIYEAQKNNSDNIIIWGSGKATREFLYVKDAVKAIILAMLTYESSLPLNIGNGLEVNIVDLVYMLKEIMGYDGKVIFDNNKPDGQPRRCIDINRMKKELNFTPTTQLRDGLIETVQYFKDITIDEKYN